MELSLSNNIKRVKEWCSEHDIAYDELNTFFGFGLPFITSDALPDGEIYYVGGNIILGTGVLTDKEWVRREVKRIFHEDPDMKKWYEYVGLI